MSTSDPVRARLVALLAVADRLDELAETAALMNDQAGAENWRAKAADIRERALDLLDRGK